jgi:hypothetical protein
MKKIPNFCVNCLVKSKNLQTCPLCDIGFNVVFCDECLNLHLERHELDDSEITLMTNLNISNSVIGDNTDLF